MGYITFLEDFPWAWNLIFGVVIMMVYIKGIIAVMDKLVTSGKFSSDLSRKVIHTAAGSFIWVWLFMDTSDGWSFAFNIVVPFLFFLTFIQKGTKGTADDPDVKTMTRTGDPSELLKGPLYFTIVMMAAGTLLFGSYAGMLMMAIVGWGDGFAPYIGQRWGNRKYKTLGREKSIEGSIGFLTFSILGSLVFLSILGIIGGPLDATDAVLAYPGEDIMMIIIVIVILAIVTMIIEALSPSDVDNLLIPVTVVIILLIIDFALGSEFVVWLRPLDNL